MGLTARAAILHANQILRVVGESESVSTQGEADGLIVLNRMLTTWHAKGLRLPVGVRSQYTLTSSLHTQTIGPSGATLTGARPVGELEAAKRVESNIEYPVRVLTRAQWQAEDDRTSTGVVDRLRYEPTVPNGTFYLFPVPSSAQVLSIYYQTPALLTFADLTTSYDLRNGYEEALVYDLAKRLAAFHGKQLDPASIEILREAMDAITTRNEAETLPQQQLDPALRDWSYGGDFDMNTGDVP